MILQALVDYYEALAQRGEISPPGWCLEKVSFSLNLAPDGRLLGVIPQMHNETRGKKEVEVPDQMQVPERVVRSSGIKANFLCDNTTYLLGFDDKGKPQRTRDCFEASKKLHLEILKTCQGAAARAVKGFFENWQPETAREHPVLKPYLDSMAAANLVFRIDGGNCAQDDPEIRQAWQRYYQQAGDTLRLPCLVTGKNAPVAQLHGKIKGVPGAQSSGASLVSFNAPAYESYGQGDDQLPNAPVSEYAAFAYVTALNRLLDNHERRFQIGDSTVVFWAEDADPKLSSMFWEMMNPEPDTESRVAGVLRNLSLGRPVANIDLDKRFYVLGLAPNAARISVRFFLQDNFGIMLQNLARHYDDLAIQKPSFDSRQYLSVPALLAETVNPNSRDKAASPLLSGAVMRAILTGGAYPQALFGSVLTRIRADGRITRGRAAIIKAYLTRNHNHKEVTTVALNENSNNRAYVLGRLFAVLEDAQKQASPGINTTIKDRFFTSACATPGSVFPQLLKLSQYHISKSDYGYFYEREKARLLDKLEIDQNPLPAHLSLQEQGIFMLGYYHQMQARYNNKKEEQNNGSNQ